MSAICLRNGVLFSASDEAIEIRKNGLTIRLSPKHLAFVPDMARHFAQYASLVVSQDGIVDYSHPRLHRYTSTGLEFELSSFPEEQSAIDDYFRWYTPKAGDTVFDVGAYCGVSTYHLAKAVGLNGKVIAFEPDRVNLESLTRNCERHALSNVTVVPLAISGASGRASFNSEGTLGSGLSRSVSRDSTGESSDVETITLEEACHRYGVPQFIKMDVEGAELEILGAAKHFLSTKAIHFALDTNHLVGNSLTDRRVEQLFAECGYSATTSDESGFATTWASKD